MMVGRSTLRKQNGFTLLEVMVAVAILGAIMAAVFQILNATTQSKEYSEVAIKELTQYQTLFGIMERDFTQLSRRRTRDESGDVQERYLVGERYLLDSQYDGIAFVRDGWRNPAQLLPRSELQAVAYRVNEGNLERMYRTYVDMLDDTEFHAYVLMENIEDFKIEYRGKGEKWNEKWPHTNLPRAVAVSVKLKDLDPIRRIFLLPGEGEGEEVTQ